MVFGENDIILVKGAQNSDLGQNNLVLAKAAQNCVFRPKCPYCGKIFLKLCFARNGFI